MGKIQIEYLPVKLIDQVVQHAIWLPQSSKLTEEKKFRDNELKF